MTCSAGETVRLSEFWRAVADEFGEVYGRALVRDLVLSELGDLTAERAIAAGVPVRDDLAGAVPRHGRARGALVRGRPGPQGPLIARDAPRRASISNMSSAIR